MSPTTVSHALNGKGYVDAHTRERVKEAARALGYRPSIRAQWDKYRAQYFDRLALAKPLP